VLPTELLSHPALKWSLRFLDISHNPQLHPTDYLVEDLFLPALQSLYVVSTGLTSLDGLTSHLKAPALKELNISCHRLEGHVPWIRAWFPSCTNLLASDNWFSSIDVEAARGLEVLDIRNNQIEELPRAIGLLGNHVGKTEAGRLRSFECGGNKFRVPRIVVLEKGTEAVLKDLRRMVSEADIPKEWKDEI
jgi:Leucine-rich repeat (LRR) protein